MAFTDFLVKYKKYVASKDEQEQKCFIIHLFGAYNQPLWPSHYIQRHDEDKNNNMKLTDVTSYMMRRCTALVVDTWWMVWSTRAGRDGDIDLHFKHTFFSPCKTKLKQTLLLVVILFVPTFQRVQRALQCVSC